MDEFPPNSYAKRERPDQIKPAKAEVPEKRVEKVVEGKVIRKKKSLGKRIKEHFLGNDSASVGEYVLDSVLIPAFKDMIADATRSGVEHFLFGGEDRRYGNRGRTTRSRGSREPIDYSRRYRNDDRPPFPPADRRSAPSRRARGSHNFDDIILATRVEGQEVIDRLYFLLEKYEVATVADLYELLGLTSEYTDDSWGWTDLRGATVRHTRDGYLLDLPRPEPLD